MLLGRCEFGKEDYSLNIVNLPVDAEPTPDPSQEGNLNKNPSKEGNEEEPEQSNPPIPLLPKGGSGRTKKIRAQKSLFPEDAANEK